MANGNAAWMSEMADVLGDKRLDQIILPGTHDSGTASLDPNLGLAPDAPPFAFKAKAALETIEKEVEKLHKKGGFWAIVAKEIEEHLGDLSWDHLAHNVLIHGCQTQDELIAQQLESGIRYFDIRLGRLGSTVRITHNMFGQPVSEVFDAIVAFTDANPQEILVLDFQHFNVMSADEKPAFVEEVAGSLASTFGARLAPNAVGSKVTPKALWEAGTPIIALFSDYDLVPEQHSEHIWNRGEGLESDWADTDDVEKLMPALTRFLRDRAPDPTSLFVTQGVLTTQTPEIGSPPKDEKELPAYVADLVQKIDHLKETYNIRKNAGVATPAVAKALVSEQWASFDKNIAMIDFHGLVDYLGIVRGLNRS